MRTLLPLYADPIQDPRPWCLAASLPTRLRIDVTVVVDAPPGAGPEPATLAAIRHLTDAGVPLLGRVDLNYAARPVADLLDDVTRWAAQPVGGVFFDHAPTSPFSAGPVALAVRLARREGLTQVVLNPSVPTDPVYRELGADLCTFEGSWIDYQRWDLAGSWPGDGHLVHSVPVAQFGAARDLAASRGAGLGLVTDRTPPGPYDGLPAWCGHLLPTTAAGDRPAR
jgi:hypothetical protein